MARDTVLIDRAPHPDQGWSVADASGLEDDGFQEDHALNPCSHRLRGGMASSSHPRSRSAT